MPEMLQCLKAEAHPCGAPGPNQYITQPLPALYELGPNSMPSPWVVTSMQIQFPISMSPSVWSISTEAVTMDKVDMLVREENQLFNLHQKEKK